MLDENFWIAEFSKVFSEIPNLIVLDECSSTMEVGRDVLRSLQCNYILKTESSFTACFSLSQTAGRGRKSRNWHSPKGEGVYLTLVDSKGFYLNTLEGFSLVIGIAIKKLLEDYGLSPKLKWPNDVFIGDKKISGVLIESVPIKSNILGVLIGIGLNVNQNNFPEGLNATSMSMELKQQLSYEEVCANLVYKVVQIVEEFRDHGFVRFKNDWWSASFMQDRMVENKEMGVSGRAIGISDSGALLIETTDGLLEVSVGDVSIVH